MKHRPKYITPTSLDLVQETYRKIIEDNEITDREFDYLKRLHLTVFNVKEDDRETIINDIRELSQWKLRIK